MNETNCENTQKSCKGPKIVLAIIGMVMLTVIVVVAMLRDRIVNQQFRQITSIGQGRVQYNPDIAIINLGLQIDKAESANAGLESLNNKMSEVLKLVKEEGILPDDIQTLSYSLNPQIDYVNNVSTTTGYNVSQQLVVKIKDYDKAPERLNKVIAAASKAGANQVNSLMFDSSNMNMLKQEARIKALKDAQDKSKILSETAGEKIKNIASWYENVIQPQPNYGGMGGGIPQVVPGNREVIIEMNVTYNLK